MAELTDSWELGGVKIPNRVLLAPLAGIGNWFVRLQAQRYGAGMAFSEMVSSHAIYYRNERTCKELLKVHPDEDIVAMQLFGSDPDVMLVAAKEVAQTGAKIIDLNMGCPVPKVCKTGAGAALLSDQERAVAVVQAAIEGGGGLPVTVKLRPGRRPGDLAGVELAYRLASETEVAGLSIHPRHSSQQHKGKPDYDLARTLVEELPIPVILSGGMLATDKVLSAWEYTGAAAVMLARGSFGNPWLFSQLLTGNQDEPTVDEIIKEFEWVVDRAIEHFGEQRAASYLRKFYPWYVERVGGGAEMQDSMQRTNTTDQARAILRREPILSVN